MAAAAVVVAGVHDKSGIIQLIRTSVGATVSVVDATAGAAVTFLQAGGNATVAASSVFVDALSFSTTVLEDAWQGVDLHAVLASRRVGKLFTANISVAMDWLRTAGPTQVGNASFRIADNMAVLLSGATPFTEFEDTYFDPGTNGGRGLLVSWCAKGRVFDGNQGAAVAFVVTETNFSAAWSNPLWETLEYSVESEASRILRLAASVGEGLPPPHPEALTLAPPGALFTAEGSGHWSSRISTLLATSAVTAACLACAWTLDPVRDFVEGCWEKCAGLWHGTVPTDTGNLDGIPPVVELPVLGESYVMVAGGASSADRASTPSRMPPRPMGPVPDLAATGATESNI